MSNAIEENRDEDELSSLASNSKVKQSAINKNLPKSKQPAIKDPKANSTKVFLVTDP